MSLQARHSLALPARASVHQHASVGVGRSNPQLYGRLLRRTLRAPPRNDINSIISNLGTPKFHILTRSMKNMVYSLAL
jgi:hypothetical protein